MSINGIEILESTIQYSPIWYGVAASIFMIILMFFFLSWFLDVQEIWSVIALIICFCGFIFCLALTFDSENKTFLNQPSKIKCTIEIIDDNAWKEIGPNYTVKEKLYENKEIYIIEGKYIGE